MVAGWITYIVEVGVISTTIMKKVAKEMEENQKEWEKAKQDFYKKANQYDEELGI